MPQFHMVIKKIFQTRVTQILMASSGSYIHVESFITFIFSILVNWKRDFWTSIILPYQTI